MTLHPLKAALGPPIEDAGEETFVLFSQGFPSNNLGFVDSKVSTLEIEIAGHDYTTRQSPGLLHSTREGGTTGAVLWKVTPIMAAWLASMPSILAGVLHNKTVVVELGCGVAGLVGLVLSKFVRCYILTDQEYVMKTLRANIAANSQNYQTGNRSSEKKSNDKQDLVQNKSLQFMSLDWETDSAEALKSAVPSDSCINLLLLCDCVYNEYLVPALVQTCADICRLGASKTGVTMVLIAQQLRTDTVFELFIGSMMEAFDVWRVPDESLTPELRRGTGYAVHMATLKSPSEESK